MLINKSQKIKVGTIALTLMTAMLISGCQYNIPTAETDLLSGDKDGLQSSEKESITRTEARYEVPEDAVESGKSAVWTNDAGEPSARITLLWYKAKTHDSFGEYTDSEIMAGYSLTNLGDSALTMIKVNMMPYDEKGALLGGEPKGMGRYFQNPQNNSEKPIEPGETYIFSWRYVYHDSLGAEETGLLSDTPDEYNYYLNYNVADIEIEWVECLTDKELPAYTQPKPGNLLPVFCNDPEITAWFDGIEDNFPVKMVYYTETEDEGRETTDPEEIRKEISRISNLYVGKEAEEYTTDTYSAYFYTFIMADDTSYTFGFNDYNNSFIWHGREYLL